MAAPACSQPCDIFGPPPDYSPFFPPEWWIPIAYGVLLLLLLWRFARILPLRRAVKYAFVGAWLGALIGAGPVVVAGLMGTADIVHGVIVMELSLLALTLLAVGLCAIPRRGRTKND